MSRSVMSSSTSRATPACIWSMRPCIPSRRRRIFSAAPAVGVSSSGGDAATTRSRSAMSSSRWSRSAVEDPLDLGQRGVGLVDGVEPAHRLILGRPYDAGHEDRRPHGFDRHRDGLRGLRAGAGARGDGSSRSSTSRSASPTSTPRRTSARRRRPRSTQGMTHYPPYAGPARPARRDRRGHDRPARASRSSRRTSS